MGDGRYCGACPAGTWGSGGGQCTPCPAGTFNPVASSTTYDACLPCRPGTYSSATAAQDPSACVPCPIGTYSTTTAANASAACTPCLLGTSTAITGASSLLDCTALPGYYLSLERSVRAAVRLPAAEYDPETIAAYVQAAVPEGVGVAVGPVSTDP